ncbi:unnamed protein product [Malus baccata var. baccata]
MRASRNSRPLSQSRLSTRFLFLNLFPVFFPPCSISYISSSRFLHPIPLKPFGTKIFLTKPSFSISDILWFSFSLADDELVDQKKYLEESCQPKCVKPLIEYQACVKRVEGDDTGNKHCTGQYFDYISCVDKCVAPKLFQKLK